MPYSKRVVCINYVDPNIADQMLQDPAPKVAQFPLSVMGQRLIASDLAYRNAILSANPAHKILSYQEQQMRHPTSGNGAGGGPGYDVLRGAAIGDAGAIAGIAKLLCVKNADGSLRQLGNTQYIYDPRSPLFQEFLLESWYRIFKSWSDPLTGRTYYHGGMLDDWFMFNDSAPNATVLAEMNWHQQLNLIALNRAFPDMVWIPNAYLKAGACNAEMIENRLPEWNTFLDPHPGHVAPRLPLAIWQTGAGVVPTDAQIQAQMDIAHAKGAYFYWCETFQKIATRSFYQ